jgi:hypothetical protein
MISEKLNSKKESAPSASMIAEIKKIYRDILIGYTKRRNYRRFYG